MNYKKVKKYLACILSVVFMTGNIPVLAAGTSSGPEAPYLVEDPSIEDAGMLDLVSSENEVSQEDDSLHENASAQDSDSLQNSNVLQENNSAQDSSSQKNDPSISLDLDNPENKDSEARAESVLSEESEIVLDTNLTEAHTDLTIDKNGVVTVLAEGYQIPIDIKDMSVAVWSKDNGQDDLKWYKLQKTSNGLTVQVDLRNHGAKDDLYYFHLYYKTADDKMVCFSIKEYVVAGVFKTSLEAIETQNGYQLVLTDPTTTPKSVEFAIWSEEGGQDDLKWFPASYDSTKKRSVCNWDLSNLKHLGNIIIHCYVNDMSGKKVFQGPMTVNLGRPEINTITATFDADTGKYTVNISDIKNAGFIKKIEVPVWSDSKQADLKWQDAVKNADGTYSVVTPISFHAGKSGTYQVHVYVTDKTNTRVFGGKTTFTVDPSAIRTKTEEILSGTVCEIRAVNYKELSGARNVRVAFWSDQNGQDDLKWYPLTSKTEVHDGKTDTVWYSKIDLKNHGAVNGRYFAHIYYDNAAGKPVCVSTYSFTVSDLFKTSVEAIGNNGTYKLVLTSPTIAARSATFAVWSDEGGQDDLKWYEASYNSTTNQAAVTWTGDNLKHSGLVHIHCYAKDAKGTMVFQGKTTVEIKGLSLQSVDASFTQSSGKFTVKANGLDGMVKKMEAAVWTDSKQADLKWYAMTGDSSGNWTYTGNIQNHGFRTGVYNVHIYATDTSGKKVFLGKTTFSAEAAGIASIRTVQANASYQVVVSGIDTAVKSVSAAVWSDKGGQDDLIWYPASKSGSNYIATVPIRQHKTAGHYIVHVYVTRTDGSSYITKGLMTGFDVSTDISAEYAFTDRQTDNGTFVIHMIDTGYNPAKTVTFNVWTDNNGQDDLESIQAARQADGSWAAVVNPAKHKYEAGKYCINSVMVLENGTNFTTTVSDYTVSLETQFYTVVASEESATAILRGHTDAAAVSVFVWSTNGGQDDLKEYPAVKQADGWSVEIKKKDHGSAGQYNAHVYVDGVLAATDLFSFDEYRLADSWYSISTAHGAGGQGVNKKDIYTNCISAMENSYQAGYRTFEIDVLLTKDNQPVLYHTWNTDILDNYKYSKADTAGPTYAEFMNDTMYGGKYGTSDFKNLLTYLKQHPEVQILLDTKYRTVDELKQLYTVLLNTANSMNAVSNLQNQIIPYFFTTDQYSAIRQTCSFKEYHYATYASYPWQNGTFPISAFQSVMQFCKMNRILSISMWDKLVTAEMLRMADSYGINVYVHTTDDPATAERLLKLGAAGIITNTITPVQAIGFIS